VSTSNPPFNFTPQVNGHKLRLIGRFGPAPCILSQVTSNTLVFSTITTPVVVTTVPMIAPNPVSSLLTVYALNKDVKVRQIIIVGPTGQPVFSATIQPTQQTISIPVQGLLPGIYRLVLTDADGKQSSLNFVKL
jgi:hypothetical protein